MYFWGMKLIPLLPVAAAAVILAAGCKENHKDLTMPNWNQTDPVDTTIVTPVDTTSTQPVDTTSTTPVVADGWTDVTSDYSGLPEYIRILKGSEEMQGRKAIAFIADIDASRQSFCVWGIKDPSLSGSSDALQTPTQVYTAKSKPSVVINGGFFYTDSGKSYAASLAVSSGTLLSPNINYTSKDWVTIYYPTRAVFLEHKDGSYEAAWSYYASSRHYVYQQPAENSWENEPLQAPNANFPSKAATFEAVNGIGGGPVLLKNGEVVNSYLAEMFDYGGINPTNPNTPRTAIGITADNHLVLFVCEGREQTEGVLGFTTEELANILKDYGCTDAINLDGGGSTMMLVNGSELIKPSDGKQRSVGSCVYIP